MCSIFITDVRHKGASSPRSHSWEGVEPGLEPEADTWLAVVSPHHQREGEAKA